jgi:hypothetical protein
MLKAMPKFFFGKPLFFSLLAQTQRLMVLINEIKIHSRNIKINA